MGVNFNFLEKLNIQLIPVFALKLKGCSINLYGTGTTIWKQEKAGA